MLGELERRLNAEGEDEPPPVPVSSNGHGNIEMAVGAAELLDSAARAGVAQLVRAALL